jgi:hypothetical protein
MRMKGDPPADDVIAALARAGETAAVAKLMETLVRNEQVPPDALPAIVRDFLASSEKAMQAVDAARVRSGEELFERFGCEMLMTLGFYALPEAYAAANGVQVLHRSAYLAKRPMQRVWETTQFLVDVMTAGGLAPGGMGLRTAQKVRLMHAAVRHLVRARDAEPWDAAALGVPINQEDLAATLMTFSYVVLEGLGRLGIDVPANQKSAFLYAWQTIGAVMGVDARLIPADLDEAWSLTNTIAARQIRGSKEGKQLTAALVEGLEGLLPLGLKGFIPGGMRFFLEQDTITGRDVAALLDIPHADWVTRFMTFGAKLPHPLEDLANEDAVVSAVMRHLKMGYLELLLKVERGPGRPAFRIPAHLPDLWRNGN